MPFEKGKRNLEIADLRLFQRNSTDQTDLIRAVYIGPAVRVVFQSQRKSFIQ